MATAGETPMATAGETPMAVDNPGGGHSIPGERARRRSGADARVSWDPGVADPGQGLEVWILDELLASEEVRDALDRDTGSRVELADVAREAGFDPAELGL